MSEEDSVALSTQVAPLRPDEPIPVSPPTTYILAFDYDQTLTDRHTGGTPGSPCVPPPRGLEKRAFDNLLTEKSDKALEHLANMSRSPLIKIVIVTRANGRYFIPHFKARLARIGVSCVSIGDNRVGFTKNDSDIPTRFKLGTITVISGSDDFDKGNSAEWGSIKMWSLRNFVSFVKGDPKKTFFIDDSMDNVKVMERFIPGNVIHANITDPENNVETMLQRFLAARKADMAPRQGGGHRRRKTRQRKTHRRTRRRLSNRPSKQK